MPWQQYNPNPNGARTGDCSTRALAAALGIGWDDAYALKAAQGYRLKDETDSDRVWGAVLRAHGFRRHLADDDCTVDDFSQEHDHGTYIVCPKNHAVCIKDGCYMDTWDSGDEIINLYWSREG